MRRERQPVAPEWWPLALVFRRLVERPVDDAAGIHPLVEELDRLALAAAVGPAEQDDQRKARRLEQALRVQQLPPQFRDFGFVVGLRDLPPRLCCFEHGPPLFPQVDGKDSLERAAMLPPALGFIIEGCLALQMMRRVARKPHRRPTAVASPARS